ncbi:hypothetical protein J5N97_020209 [Dioscorea zingiberensis]|uniref:Uncharacterized protein n=1 Tax=Dioscorea zingiberensis TaxID=325984 RepID=A0A9D5CHJ4_9LILI|nr:hypothetical protein J5N97_020209 [Dioscorea zingiberensis]
MRPSTSEESGNWLQRRASLAGFIDGSASGFSTTIGATTVGISSICNSNQDKVAAAITAAKEPTERSRRLHGITNEGVVRRALDDTVDVGGERQLASATGFLGRLHRRFGVRLLNHDRGDDGGHRCVYAIAIKTLAAAMTAASKNNSDAADFMASAVREWCGC